MSRSKHICRKKETLYPLCDLLLSLPDAIIKMKAKEVGVVAGLHLIESLVSEGFLFDQTKGILDGITIVGMQ